MQRKTWMTGMVLALAAAGASAQNCTCQPSASRMNQTDLAQALSGRTACAVLGADRWQEFHNASGSLLELGNTAGGETVGSWSIVGTGANAVVRYAYNGGGTYDYQMCKEGTGTTVESLTYHFCGARNITNARLVANTGTCGSGFTRP